MSEFRFIATARFWLMATLFCSMPTSALAQPWVAKRLKVGEVAPLFNLQSIDGKHDTDLEKLDKSVVLFFGSYS